MAMTRREQIAKDQIIRTLQKSGYPTYASLLDLFHVNLTEDPNVVAYMEPGKGRIVINSGLNIDQVSTIVRHEILHEYLNHHKRLVNKLAKERGLDPDKLDDLSVKEIENTIYSNKAFNIAGDYEISNRGYTDNDKRIARSILLNGKRLKGLVTEDDHPDWVDKSLEDMYDLLRQEMKDDPQQGPGDSGNGGSSSPDNNSSGNPKGKPSGDPSNDPGDSLVSGPTIGSKGSKEIQDAEEAKREAEDVTKGIQDEETKDELEKEIDKASDALDKEKEKLDKKGDSKGSSSSKKKDDKDIDINLDRINQIKKAFEDAKVQAEITREAERAIDNERIKKAADADRKYNQTPLKRFIDDLNRFVKKATAHGRGDTWKRFNRKYQDSGIIKPGSSRLANKKIPVINVYFDRSGSWDDAKIAVGMQAVGTLNNYVRKGEIKINLFYFADRVGSTPDSVGYGTEGTPIMEHIQDTKPDNVIIMTDSDISDIKSPVTVPGAVWLLFKGGVSHNLIENIHGQSETKIYEI